MRSYTFILSLASLILSLSTPLAAQDSEVKIQRITVTHNISMLLGKGGNIGLFTGSDGTFLIDDQFAPLTGKILAAVKEAGGDTPRFLMNTHYHFDHTGGNENLGKAGSLIIAHDNVRKLMSIETVIKAFNATIPAQPKDALPVITFGQDLSLHFNDETIHAMHIPSAHTSGDSVIFFEGANVVHAGDIMFNGMFPFIDSDHGGSLKGMIDAVEKLLSLVDDDTRIIPGHGPLASKADLKAYHGMLFTAYQRLSQLKAEGNDLEAIVAAEPLADLEKNWASPLYSTADWIGIVYPGI